MRLTAEQIPIVAKELAAIIKSVNDCEYDGEHLGLERAEQFLSSVFVAQLEAAPKPSIPAQTGATPNAEAQRKSNPSSLAQQIEAARAEVAKWSPEKRASVQLEGRSSAPPSRGATLYAVPTVATLPPLPDSAELEYLDDAAQAFLDSMKSRANLVEMGVRFWTGWALVDAYKAGAAETRRRIAQAAPGDPE